MRVLSSPKVLASAEQIGKKITDMYLEPNKTFFELHEMIDKNALYILGDFGEACREELSALGPTTVAPLFDVRYSYESGHSLSSLKTKRPEHS